MRHVLLLAVGLSLAFATLGCKTFQYTAGVCDCDPPPVHSVLQSPYAPAGPVAPAAAVVPAVKVMPHVAPDR